MDRHAQPLLVLPRAYGFLLLVMLTLGPLVGGRLRPTELQPGADPAVCCGDYLKPLPLAIPDEPDEADTMAIRSVPWHGRCPLPTAGRYS